MKLLIPTLLVLNSAFVGLSQDANLASTVDHLSYEYYQNTTEQDLIDKTTSPTIHSESDAIPFLESTAYFNAAKKTIVVEENKNRSYRILNSSGKLIKKGWVNKNSQDIDVEHLSSGTFYILIDGKMITTTHRIFIF